MSNNRSPLRIIAALLLIAVMNGCIPAALAQEATINTRTYVFQKPSTSSASIKVSKGMEVEVVGVDGQWAMIEKDGNYAFISTKYLDMESDSKKEDKEDKKEESSTVEKFDDPIPAQINSRTYVYQKPSTSSKSIKVSKGMDVDVLGVSGQWAMIESKGNIAYISTKYLDMNTGSSSDKKEEEKPSMTIQEIFASEKYSNEELCYAYAVKVMGYNRAAACGLLANIKVESGFRPDASGDSGRSYGICQWFSARKTRLMDWCEKKGYDPSKLYSQLEFLHYELENYYPKVDKYLKNVPDSAEGAYDAAYYFCYNFEAPANKAAQSTSRGNSAQNNYFPKYA